MPSPVDKLLDEIRGHGGRVTPARRAVLDAILNGTAHHFTAADVYDAVRVAEPGTNRATVYRTLDLLTGMGILKPLQLDSGSTVYHRTDHRHGHLTCTTCGRVVELPAALLGDMAHTIRHQLGFTLDTDRFAATGTCDRCS